MDKYPADPFASFDYDAFLASFSLEDPDLDKALDDNAFRSGHFPYAEKLSRKVYERELRDLQLEMIKVLNWVKTEEQRLLILFEGRDAAGKGGTINAFRTYLNPRHARITALGKPTEREMREWYFQRYIDHLPVRGEIGLFDRSWYNRAVVEPVMGFCEPEQTTQFLKEVPNFERLLVDNGIILIKFWLNVGRAEQIKRFHKRQHDPLKSWKLSWIDIEGMKKWDDYTSARDRMFAATHTDAAPWTILRSNDKRRARLNAMRHVLHQLDYPNKQPDRLQPTDPLILGGPDLAADS